MATSLLELYSAEYVGRGGSQDDIERCTIYSRTSKIKEPFRSKMCISFLNQNHRIFIPNSSMSVQDAEGTLRADKESFKQNNQIVSATLKLWVLIPAKPKTKTPTQTSIHTLKMSSPEWPEPIKLVHRTHFQGLCEADKSENNDAFERRVLSRAPDAINIISRGTVRTWKHTTLRLGIKTLGQSSSHRSSTDSGIRLATMKWRHWKQNLPSLDVKRTMKPLMASEWRLATKQPSLGDFLIFLLPLIMVAWFHAFNWRWQRCIATASEYGAQLCCWCNAPVTSMLVLILPILLKLIPSKPLKHLFSTDFSSFLDIFMWSWHFGEAIGTYIHESGAEFLLTELGVLAEGSLYRIYSWKLLQSVSTKFWPVWWKDHDTSDF